MKTNVKIYSKYFIKQAEKPAEVDFAEKTVKTNTATTNFERVPGLIFAKIMILGLFSILFFALDSYYISYMALTIVSILAIFAINIRRYLGEKVLIVSMLLLPASYYLFFQNQDLMISMKLDELYHYMIQFIFSFYFMIFVVEEILKKAWNNYFKLKNVKVYFSISKDEKIGIWAHIALNFFFVILMFFGAMGTNYHYQKHLVNVAAAVQYMKKVNANENERLERLSVEKKAKLDKQADEMGIAMERREHLKNPNITRYETIQLTSGTDLYSLDKNVTFTYDLRDKILLAWVIGGKWHFKLKDSNETFRVETTKAD